LNLIISHFRISAVYASGCIVDTWKAHGGVLLGRRGEYDRDYLQWWALCARYVAPFRCFVFSLAVTLMQ
jgi:hypothetical protein